MNFCLNTLKIVLFFVMCWVFYRITDENKGVTSVVLTWINTHLTYLKLEPYQAVYFLSGLIIYLAFLFWWIFCLVLYRILLLGLGFELFWVYVWSMKFFLACFMLCVTVLFVTTCISNSFKFKFSAISHNCILIKSYSWQIKITEHEFATLFVILIDKFNLSRHKEI